MLETIKTILVEDLKIKNREIVELDELSKLVYERIQLVKSIQADSTAFKRMKYNKINKKIIVLIRKINGKL